MSPFLILLQTLTVSVPFYSGQRHPVDWVITWRNSQCHEQVQYNSTVQVHAHTQKVQEKVVHIRPKIHDPNEDSQ